MFKIAAPPIIAGSILCALQAATGPPAFALDQWVELTNNTRMTIVEVYISHVGAQLWTSIFWVLTSWRQRVPYGQV